MEHYILTHDKSGEVMKMYQEMRLRALCHSIRYPAYKSGQLNVSEFARVCDMSRTTVYKYIEILD
jgi:hypothetical protein